MLTTKEKVQLVRQINLEEFTFSSLNEAADSVGLDRPESGASEGELMMFGLKVKARMSLIYVDLLEGEANV